MYKLYIFSNCKHWKIIKNTGKKAIYNHTYQRNTGWRFVNILSSICCFIMLRSYWTYNFEFFLIYFLKSIKFIGEQNI